MGRRDNQISKSILSAIFHDQEHDKRTVIGRILAFFSFFRIVLARYADSVFKRLRDKEWEIDEDEYRESFRSNGKDGELKAVGDLGYSGSTFFTTPNSKYLIKSLPRPSEYRYFAHDLLNSYTSHITNLPNSLLVRITDFLYSPYLTLGSLLGLAPACHIVMENILYGQSTSSTPNEWETYDLKPISYFYPERDIAGGYLASESTKERLVDKFEDRIRVPEYARIQLLETLEADTKLLSTCNAVDYSLFLVRYPASSASSVATIPAKASLWRSGVESTDGKWVYRAVVLDFFWAKHRMQAKLMTGLIKSFNFFARKGPMSITTDAPEYRNRFLRMVEGLFEEGLVEV
ncbi:Phosphatidylinositol-4-phosphate 5-kinase core [Venturia nashicola]|nr:Phosphatidylinositol-4-phosphate 5-kinase core [Venturia nashicola]